MDTGREPTETAKKDAEKAEEVLKSFEKAGVSGTQFKTAITSMMKMGSHLSRYDRAQRRFDEDLREQEIIKRLQGLIVEVKKIPPVMDDEDILYEFVMSDGKIFTIPSNDLITPRTFKKKFLEAYDELIPLKHHWNSFINELGPKTTLVNAPEDNDDVYTVERLIKQLKNCALTKDRLKAKDDRNLMLCEDGEKVLYAGLHIQSFLKRVNSKLSMTKFSRVKLLRPYRDKEVKIIRVGGGTTRFWSFQMDALKPYHEWSWLGDHE